MSADKWQLLGRTERKLYEAVAQLLPSDEEIRAAFVVYTGPGAGRQVLATGLFGMIGGALGSLVAGLGANKRRSFMTIVVTDRGVLMFDNRSLRVPVPPATRYADLSVIGEINDTFGGSYVEIGRERFAVEGIWVTELYKLKRLQRGG